jgi:hypothetical protein
MRSIILFSTIVLLLTGLVPAYASEPSSSLSNRIITEARHILSVAKESHYQHTTHVDEAAGVYDLDCSGLLCFILKTVAPEHLKVVPAAKRHARPLALQFYEFITAAGDKGRQGWREITRVQDARPGDVLVWRKAEQVAGKDTGHVMIVDEAPVEDGAGVYRIVVIDSTESPHGSDTRKDGASGVGRGTMWFVADQDGKPVAYHWKLRTGKQHDMQIAIGRAIETNN